MIRDRRYIIISNLSILNKSYSKHKFLIFSNRVSSINIPLYLENLANANQVENFSKLINLVSKTNLVFKIVEKNNKYI